MPSKKPKIAVILPVREEFNNWHRGAIALCFADFTLHSQYKDNTTIIGATNSDFHELSYVEVKSWKKWYLRNNHAYANRIAAMVIMGQFTHVEVQNRPLTFNYLAKKLPASIALSLHFHNDPQVMKGLKTASQRQKVLNRAAAIYCVSDFIREQYIEGLNEELEKVHVIYNGLDTQKTHSDKKEKIILFVGRIIPQKGALPLAQAFSIVAKSLPDWQFVVSGESKKGSSTPYERSTRESLAELGQQCLYTGYIQHSEVMNYFAKAEIAVVPSIFEEPFGRTALEALACSSALITSGSGGLAEIVGDEGGIVVNPVTPENLAQAILDLAKDDIARKKIQENGYARAVEIFDIRSVANQLDCIRQSLLPVF